MNALPKFSPKKLQEMRIRLREASSVIKQHHGDWEVALDAAVKFEKALQPLLTNTGAISAVRDAFHANPHQESGHTRWEHWLDAAQKVRKELWFLTSSSEIGHVRDALKDLAGG